MTTLAELKSFTRKENWNDLPKVSFRNEFYLDKRPIRFPLGKHIYIVESRGCMGNDCRIVARGKITTLGQVNYNKFTHFRYRVSLDEAFYGSDDYWRNNSVIGWHFEDACYILNDIPIVDTDYASVPVKDKFGLTLGERLQRMLNIR